MTQKIKVQVDTGWANGTHTDYWDLPIGWESMDDSEKKDWINECAQDFLHEKCEAYAELVESEND